MQGGELLQEVPQPPTLQVWHSGGHQPLLRMWGKARDGAGDGGWGWCWASPIPWDHGSHHQMAEHQPFFLMGRSPPLPFTGDGFPTALENLLVPSKDAWCTCVGLLNT